MFKPPSLPGSAHMVHTLLPVLLARRQSWCVCAREPWLLVGSAEQVPWFGLALFLLLFLCLSVQSVFCLLGVVRLCVAVSLTLSVKLSFCSFSHSFCLFMALPSSQLSPGEGGR